MKKKMLALSAALALLFSLVAPGAVMAGYNHNLGALTVIGSTPWNETPEGMVVTATGDDRFCMSAVSADNFTLETKISTTWAAGLMINAKADPTKGSYIVQLDATANAVRIIGLPFTGFDKVATHPLTKGQVYALKVVVANGNIKVSVDGSQVIDFNGTRFTSGLVGLYANNGRCVFQDTLLVREGQTTNVDAVTVDKQTLTMAPGASRLLSADVMPLTAVDRRVTFSAAPAGIVELTPAGGNTVTVKALAAGQATVTATSVLDGTKSAACAVTVTGGYVNPDIYNGDFEQGATGWTYTGDGAASQPSNVTTPGMNGQYAFNSGIGTVYYVADGALKYVRSNEGDQLGVIKQALAENVSIEADVTLGADTLFSFMAKSNATATQGFLCILTPATNALRYIQLPYKGELRTQNNVGVPANKTFLFKMNYYKVAGGNKIEAFIDGRQIFNYTDTANNLNGSHVGLFNFRDTGTVDNLKVHDYTGGVQGAQLYADDFSTNTIDNYFFRDNTSTRSGAPKLVAVSEPFLATKKYLRFIASCQTGSGMEVSVRDVATGDASTATLTGGTGSKNYLPIEKHTGKTVQIYISDQSAADYLVADDFSQVSRIPLSDYVSLLEPQVGYHTQDVKKLYLRSADPTPPVDPATVEFSVVGGGTPLFNAKPVYWGEKWGSYWWTLDISRLQTPGVYYVTGDEGGYRTKLFHVRDDIFTNSQLTPGSEEQVDLKQIAMDQLDARLKKTADGLADGWPLPGWTEEYLPGWRDCASEIRELSSHVVTLHGLTDMYDNKTLYNSLSQSYKDKLIAQILWGCDYLVFSQERSSNPLTNGRFNHDGARQTDYGTTDFHNWHDTAYAITGLMRAYEVVKDIRPDRAAAYLACAKLAYENAVYRPYNLASDIAGKSNADGVNYGTNETNYTNNLARSSYDRPSDWTIPTTLKTKDKLTFTWACTLLYRNTNEQKYLDSAVAYAKSAAERQFVDWENPIEGVFGNFYAFEDDNESFLLEWNQNHRFHMGNIEPTNLKGFMELYELLPKHPDRALWYNTIHTYVEEYAKGTARLSPLGIYPLTAYTNPAYGGIKFFQVTNHGFTGMYGQIAKNFMELADFLNDKELQVLANNNLEFVAGLNPGIPTSYDEKEWYTQTLIRGLGNSYFDAKHGIIPAPMGSGQNGFSADTQFNQQRLGVHPDAPKGIINSDGSFQFNEDYLPHSHGYVAGVAQMEDVFTLNLNAFAGGAPAVAIVTVTLDNGQTTTFTGNTTLKNLPLLQSGTVTFSLSGKTITRTFDTVGGGTKDIAVDFAKALGAEITLPPVIRAGETAAGTLTVENQGASNVSVTPNLTAYGLSVVAAPEALTLTPGERKTIPFTVRAGLDITTSTLIATLDNTEALYSGKVASFNMDDLYALIGRAEKLLPDKALYRADTWAALEAALSPAKAIQASPATTGYDEYIKARDDLGAALDGLVLKVTGFTSGTPVVITVKRGRTLQLTPTWTPDAVKSLAVTYTSSNQTVASVGLNSGLITGLKAGMTMIVLTAEDGSNLKTQVVVNVIS